MPSETRYRRSSGPCGAEGLSCNRGPCYSPFLSPCTGPGPGASSSGMRGSCPCRNPRSPRHAARPNLNGLRCHRENHAPGEDLVADMLLGKCREHQAPGRRVPAHREPLPGVGGCRRPGPARSVVPSARLSPCPVLPRGLLFLLPVLPLRCPVRLAPLAEFLPPLGPAAAGSVLAAGEDCAVAELDRKGPVLVGRRERALVENEKRAAAVRFLGPHPDAVIGEPVAQIEALVLQRPAAAVRAARSGAWLRDRGAVPGVATLSSSGAERIRLLRYGRSGVLSPFRETVP